MRLPIVLAASLALAGAAGAAADAPPGGPEAEVRDGAASVAAARASIVEPLWWMSLRPSKVVGPDDCGECHDSAHGVWLETAHAEGFRSLARSDAARAVADALGVRRIKREPSCLSCHFLPAWDDDDPAELVPVAGVACESCHGASADWIDVHADLGPGRGPESPEHRTARLAASHEAGLRGPSTLHALASACYSCHVVPDAGVVDGSPHPASPDFDLVAATQGEIRHNFLRGDGENAAATPEHRRLLLALGRLLDLEWSLRALAEAPAGGRQHEAMTARLGRSRDGVGELAALAPLPELEAALAATADLVGADAPPPSPEAAESVAEAAEAVAEAGRRLAERDREGRRAPLEPFDALLASP